MECLVVPRHADGGLAVGVALELGARLKGADGIGDRLGTRWLRFTEHELVDQPSAKRFRAERPGFRMLAHGEAGERGVERGIEEELDVLGAADQHICLGDLHLVTL